MDDRRRTPAPLNALAGGVTFGGLTWLVGDGGPLRAVVTGGVFAATWLITARIAERRRRRLG